METKSTHQAELVEINLQPHPNADTLSIITIFGYVYVGKTEVWEKVPYGIWFPPDSLLDTHLPEFNELAKDAKYNADSSKGGSFARIKAKRLRDVVSYGYMTPASAQDVSDYLEGKQVNYFERYGAAHYDPPMQSVGGSVVTGGEVAKGPGCYHVKYDVDSFQRYAKTNFVEGEPVFVTEKVHGCNARFVFHNGEFYCGSRTEWKKEFATPPNPDDIETGMRAKLAGKMGEDELNEKVVIMRKKFENPSQPPQNMWWKALRQYPDMMAWLERNPDTIVYGEVYGAVQNLNYGVPKGEVRIAVFDIMKDGKWLDAKDANLSELPWVPVLMANYPFDFDELVALAEGRSLILGADNIREGIVVKPMKERTSHAGRVNFKIVSSSYLEMK